MVSASRGGGAGMNFYQHHIGDYATATRHLSWEEDLAYRRLIEAYYAHEQPLPLDRKRCYKLAVCQTAKHRAAVDAVLDEFFTKTDQGYRHKRFDEEIAEFYKARSRYWWNALTNEERCALQAARNAAKISATPKWLTEHHHLELTAFYIESRRRTAETGIPHQVDHIIPLRSSKVCGLHVPWNLQILTAEQNQKKSNSVLQ